MNNLEDTIGSILGRSLEQANKDIAKVKKLFAEEKGTHIILY